MQKEFLGYVFSARRNSNFREKGLPKLTLRIGRYFPVILSVANFYYLSQPKSGVFNYRAKYDRYMITNKKNRPKMCRISDSKSKGINMLKIRQYSQRPEFFTILTRRALTRPILKVDP